MTSAAAQRLMRVPRHCGREQPHEVDPADRAGHDADRQRRRRARSAGRRCRTPARSARPSSAAPTSDGSAGAQHALGDLRGGQRDEGDRADRRRSSPPPAPTASATSASAGALHAAGRGRARRRRPARAPAARARRARRAAAARRSAISSGPTSSQVRPLSEPSSQRVASWASSMRARESMKSVSASISAADRDADEHEPEARQPPALEGEHVDDRGGGEPADHRARRRLQPAAAEHRDDERARRSRSRPGSRRRPASRAGCG